MLGLTHGGDAVAPARQRLELGQAQHRRLRRRRHLVQQHRVHRRRRRVHGLGHAPHRALLELVTQKLLHRVVHVPGRYGPASNGGIWSTDHTVWCRVG